MDFTAALKLAPTWPLEEAAVRLGDVLGLAFIPDASGKYDEFPAYVANVIGVEVALLGIPDHEDMDEEAPVENYGLLVQTIADTDDHGIEVDLSIHLKSLLRAAGITGDVGNA